MTDLGKQAKWVDPYPTAGKQPPRKSTASRRRHKSDYSRHRQRLYHVYGSICWLCGQPNAAQIDHVIPLSQGGSNDFSNLRLAHDECNVARNRKNHLWHKAPEVNAKGFPRSWNGMKLVRQMWDEEFVASLEIHFTAGRKKSKARPNGGVDLGQQAKWVDPAGIDLGQQARWIDPDRSKSS